MVEYARNGEVRIAYETFGDPAAGEPLVMIMGLDFSMVWWHDDLCRALVEAGFAVLRFDNRDTGLSTRFTSPERSPLAAALNRTPQAYTTLDLLTDVAAVMDAVGWRSAHVLGGSLGGAVAQAMALIRPDRVRSLISCMSLPVGSGPVRTMRYLRPGIFVQMARGYRAASTRADEVENLVRIYRLIASPGYPVDEAWVRSAAELTVERGGFDRGTSARQMAAGRGIRIPDLSGVAVPTLVVSGEDDPVVTPRGGRDTAARIPGARFVSYPGMGHELPRALWPAVIEEIVRTVRPGD
jgi:pimeloyl-ACP methyl ester carboxylesterase